MRIKSFDESEFLRSNIKLSATDSKNFFLGTDQTKRVGTVWGDGKSPVTWTNWVNSNYPQNKAGECPQVFILQDFKWFTSTSSGSCNFGAGTICEIPTAVDKSVEANELRSQPQCKLSPLEMSMNALNGDLEVCLARNGELSEYAKQLEEENAKLKKGIKV